jgi:hypothetical protein
MTARTMFMGLASVLAIGLAACEVKDAEFFTPDPQPLTLFTGSAAGTITINGAPAAGITVSAGLKSTTTGSDGSYRLDGLLPGGTTITAAGLPANATCTPPGTSLAIITAGATSTVNFSCTVPTTGSVAGRVTLNGAGIGGIAVTVSTRSTTTAADGTYRIDNVPPGAVNVGVGSLPQPGASCSPSLVGVTVTVGAVNTVNFVCTAPTTGAVTGTVTINGIPTDGIGVTIGANTQGALFAITGANGTYRVDGLPPGTTTVSITEAPPGATCSPITRSVTITAGVLAIADIACSRPTVGSVTGTITINGTPTGGILVASNGRTATTNSQGSYRIDSLPPGVQLVVPITLPPNTTCNPSSRNATIVAGQTATADFVCTRVTTGSIAGRVLINGTGAAGITVSIGGTSMATGTDGTYRFDGVAPGAYTVSLTQLSMNLSCTPASRVVNVAVAEVTFADFSCITTFAISVTPSYRHFVGSSEVCAAIATSPAQPGATYSGMLTGPAVNTGISGGILNAQGQGTLRFGIGLFGTYNGTATVAGQSTTFTINVVAAAGNCPP